MSTKRNPRSAVVVAKLLDTEGFTDYTANQAERWWKENRVKTQRQVRQVASVERAIAAWAQELPTEKRLLLGKFVGMKCKQGFECGLAIGLTCMAVQNDRPVEMP